MSSKFHRAIGRPRPDTEEDLAERMAHNAAVRIADAEWRERFPVLTPENLEAACEWKLARIEELKRAALAKAGVA